MAANQCRMVVLARHVESNTFQDAQAFLDGGGERGPQISVIPNGHYRINPRLFSVKAVRCSRCTRKHGGCSDHVKVRL